jgi:hypothetical protein
MPGRASLAGGARLPTAIGVFMNSKFASLEVPVDSPRQMILIHPVTRQPLTDEKGKVAYIELYSTDSEICRRYFRERDRRRTLPNGNIRPTTPEQSEAESVQVLVALTTGWYLVGMDGTHIDVPFNAQNATDLYAATSMAWIRVQVNEFVTEIANFAKASSLN